MIPGKASNCIPRVLVIIPALNEAGSISNVIRSVKKVDSSWDVLVINDGSTDKTGAIATATADSFVIDHCINLGIGGAMQSGFKFAYENNFDIAVQCDGDGQHAPEGISTLLEALSDTENADVIIGSRFFPGPRLPGFRSTRIRRIGIRFLSFIIHLLTGLHIYDVTSGFRAYSRKALEIVSTHYPSDFPEPEALILFSKLNIKVKEVPVTMKKRQSGKSSIRGIFSLYYILKVTVALIIYTLRPAKLITSGID